MFCTFTARQIRIINPTRQMKKLRILAISFDANIQPYQLAAFRGALALKPVGNMSGSTITITVGA